LIFVLFAVSTRQNNKPAPTITANTWIRNETEKNNWFKSVTTL